MTTHRYALEIRRDGDGSTLLHTPLAPDWSPALECAHFFGARRGTLPPILADGRGSVEPIWHGELGAPYVAAFRAVVPGDSDDVVLEIPRAYVRADAQGVAGTLVERGILKHGELFQFVVTAFPEIVPPAMPATDDGFTVEAVAQALPLHDTALADLMRGAEHLGPSTDDETPVFIRNTVLDHVREHAERTADVESGGVLIGHLHRDRSVPEMFVEVTAFIPAPHTESTSTKLTFTGDTWAAVRNALALRRRDETMVGWAHHHPDWCRLRNCPLERRRQCTSTNAFFSAEDVLFMATIFPRAFHVGLLLSESHAGHATSLFGWRQGMVTHRGYYAVER